MRELPSAGYERGERLSKATGIHIHLSICQMSGEYLNGFPVN
jgi:hypothetical protein